MLTKSRVVMTMPTVPFERPLYPPKSGKGTKDGSDVIAVKRAISRLGYWPWQQFDDSYSNFFSHAVAKFQKDNKLEGTGYYGRPTHEILTKKRIPKGLANQYEFAFDQYSINLYKGYEDLSETEEILRDIWKWWDWLVANEPKIHYSQARPIYPLVRGQKPPKLPTWLDCSGTFIYAAWLAGAKSPDNIYNYSGGGNTESLQESGFRISEDSVDKWAKTHYVSCLYGRNSWDTTHVCAMKNSREVYSMGTEGGPDKYSTAHYGNPHPIIEFRAHRVL